MPIPPSVVCSTITFRHRSLPESLARIRDAGFTGIDLGALPGVCTHVPEILDAAAIASVAADVQRSGLQVRSINADIGDLNEPVSPGESARREEHLRALLDLCHAVDSPALVLPNGSMGPEPKVDLDTDLDLVADRLLQAAAVAVTANIALWVEAQHSLRLCGTLPRAVTLMDRLRDVPIGVVMDFSHIVAAGDSLREYVDLLGDRVAHVHLRDAIRGDIHRSIGNGEVDFAQGIGALLDRGYPGVFSLELETDDVAEDDRPEAARKAGEQMGAIVIQHTRKDGE
ncbi:MAG: sugar phosphate isomerase/epimerase family protein [Propioniciclava sp.]